MKKTILLTLFVLLGVGFSYAQTRVTGTVTGADDGQPLPFVTVSVKGLTTTATTDNAGKYTINVPANGKTLVFSFMGMKSLEEDIAGRSVVNAIMESEVALLEDAVVVGYGSGRKVGTTVGVVAKLKSDVIAERPTANALDGIQGKVAGLQVYSSSGEPGSNGAISMRLHGKGSLGSDDTPLYILDGIPISSGTMLTLNANDFESITVLKDASATSIYGSRGANGVIYITSKRGATNQDAKININAQYGVSSLASKSFFNSLMNAKEWADFYVAYGLYSQTQMNTILANNPNDTKWVDYYYRDNAPTFQGDISIQGGGGKTTYYISGSYFNQEGIAAASNYERYTVRSNIDSKVKSWLKVGLNLTGSYDVRDFNPFTGSNDTNRGLFWLAQPIYTPYDADGKEYDYIPGWNRYSPDYRAGKNPYYTNNAQFNGAAYVEIYPVEGLTLRSQAGLDGYDRRTTDMRYPSYLGAPKNGYRNEYFYRNATKTITNTIEYKFRVKDDHAITVLAGQEGVDNDYQSLRAYATGLTDDRLMMLNGAPSNKTVESGISEYAYLSFFGRADYGYKDKYFADFSVRNDQSSRFGANQRSAMFYSGGLMWNMKKEAFLENVSWLTSMNLRASIGSSGNSAIDNYVSQATVATSYYSGGNTIADQYNGVSGWSVGNPGNPNLTWEKQVLGTVGVDLELHGRYRLGVGYYNRTTSSMLMDVPYPYTTGFSSIKDNVGTMKNTGFDISIDLDFFKTKDWLVNFHGNFNYNWNKITELFLGLDQWTVPNTGVSYVVGKKVEYYYPAYAGVDPADGAPMWFLPGSDITELTKSNGTTKNFSDALQQSTGKPRFAPMFGGFGLNTAWRDLSLSCNFSYAIGKYLINNDRYFSENPARFYPFNQSNVLINNFWQQPGDNVFYPSNNYGMEFDDHLLENASFLRLKDITLSYSVPTSLLKKGGDFFKGVRVYVTARNLFTVTNYKGPDPEPDTNISLGMYPNTKQLSFGINVTL